MPFPVALTFPNLPRADLFHGCYNRFGGCSTGDFASLNCGQNCGDKPNNVSQNRQIIANDLACDKIITSQQVHGDHILIIDENSPPDQDADAMICATSGLGLLIQQADCQAILLYDPVSRTVANIHVGWRGNVQNIIAKTIWTMAKTFSCQPTNLLAGISPSLGPCCAEFRNYQHEFPPAFAAFQTKPTYFDLWQLSHQQLCQAGVPTRNIEIAQICTRCNHDFFSYRRRHRTGRCASVIGLQHG